MSKRLIGTLLILPALLFTFVGLIRLGWMRHGVFDLSFLHLDWIGKPHLPYWGAHMGNLIMLIVGLGFFVMSTRLLFLRRPAKT